MKVTDGLGAVTSVGVTADDCRIVAGYTDNTLRVWDISTGKDYNIYIYRNRAISLYTVYTVGFLLRSLLGHRLAVTAIVLDGDGKLVLSGSADGTIKSWNVVNGVLYKECSKW